MNADDPPDASLSLVKSTTSTGFTAAGQEIDYTYLVTNTGGSSLTGISVSDTTANGHHHDRPVPRQRSLIAPGDERDLYGHLYDDGCRRHRRVSDECRPGQCQ